MVRKPWGRSAACAWNCPGWSISTEAFFYLCFPLLLVPIARDARRSLIPVLVFWLVVVSVQMILWEKFGNGQSLISPGNQNVPVLVAQLIQYFPAGRIVEFALGIILYFVWRRDPEPEGRVVKPILAFLIAAAMLLATSDLIPEVALHNGLTSLAWAPLILAGANMRNGFMVRSWAVLLGQVSFAVYLLHLPLAYYVKSIDRRLLGSTLVQFPLLRALVTLVVVLSVSALVFRYVEEPARRKITSTWRQWKSGRTGA